MIRFFSLFTITLLFAQVAWSRHLSPDEALGRITDTSMSRIASPLSGGHAGPQLVRGIKASGADRDALYLFSDNNRFLAVSADDAAPALLGYFDRNVAEEQGNAIPPALEWWLQEYAAQVQYAQANPGSMAAPISRIMAPIDYMVKTQWNQSYPYNAKCPTFGDQQAVTGCVATAFAQVMNYHKWPEQGRGSVSYSYDMDFSEVTFDWASMLDEYDNEADRNTPEVEAVATLMQACGYGVYMDYGVDASGAWTGFIATSAHEFFDYADEMYYAERRNYTSAEWEDLVYSQLAQGLPLIYSGRDGNWDNSNGHCFICDGYDGSGYYHFNWGWGGYCDGWFLLAALVPEGVGIGGAAGGYDFSQSLIANMHPSNTEINPANGYICHDMNGSAYDKRIYSNVTPERESLAATELNFGLEFLSGSESVLVVDMGFFPLTYGEYQPSYKLVYADLAAMGLADGSYDIRFVYKEADEWKVPMWGYNYQRLLTIDFKADDIVITQTPREYPVVISDVDFNGRGLIIKGSANELTYTATNMSDDAIHWMSWLHLVRVGETAPGQSLYNLNLDLLPGETRTFTVTIPANYLRYFDTDPEYYFMFRGGEESGDIIYADQDITYRVVDPEVDGISDGTFRYLEVAEGEVIMTGLDSYVRKLSGEVVLPDQVKIDGKTYKIVSTNAGLTDLIDVYNVTSLDIRTPIRSIPAETFWDASNLQSISFPSSLESIGDYAFTYCKNLSGELKLPESLKYIGRGAFYGCYALSGSLNIPASVEYIGSQAFFNLMFDGKLTLPSSLTSIEDYAFAYCYYFEGPLVIPSSVTSIGSHAFTQSFYFDCGSVVIPQAVTSIGDAAFQECNSITDFKMLPSEVPAIGVDVFPTVPFYVATGAGDRYRESLSGYAKSIYEIGDANLSQSLTVADAVAVVNEIIGAPNASFDATCADINLDGRISISDATMVVSSVLKYNPGGMAGSPAAKVIAPESGRMVSDYSAPEGVALSVADAGAIVALQADILPSSGCVVEDVRLSEALKATHTLQTARLSDGTLRMIVFSMSNSKIELNGTPFALVGVKGNEDALQLTNILAVSADASEYALGYEGASGVGLSCGGLAYAKARVSVSGGMLSVANASGALVKVFDPSGRLVMSFQPDSDVCTRELQKGIYMVSVGNQEAVKIIL